MAVLDTRDITPRDIIAGVNDVKNTLTSWDGCMSKAYCKWPVIVGIIVGSLIALSILWCFVRCLCCGKDLVCCCFRCCNCCQPSRRQHKHLDSVPNTPHGNQYASHPMPVYAHNPYGQTATFDGKVHADSLPAMPSWDTASTRKVEVQEEESHEMDKLKPGAAGALNEKDPSPHSTMTTPLARPIPMRSEGGPGALNRTASPRLPDAGYGGNPQGANPYGYDSQTNLGGAAGVSAAQGGYRGAAPAQSSYDPYGNSPYGGYNNQNNNNAAGYGRSSPAQAYGRSSPAQAYNPNNGQQGYGRSSPPQAYGSNAQPYGGAGGNGGYQTYNGGNNNSQYASQGQGGYGAAYGAHGNGYRDV